jgi:parallel beta-helix repeat protein
LRAPKRTLASFAPLMSAGIALHIAAGTYQEILAIGADSVWIIGVDSALTILDGVDSEQASDQGAIVAVGRTGLTVRDIGVENFQIGLRWTTVTNSRIQNTTFRSNRLDGVRLNSGSSHNAIETCIVAGGDDCGIHLSGAPTNTISNNRISGSGRGICLEASGETSLVERNVVSSCLYHGVVLTNTSRAYFRSNRATNNGEAGFFLSGNSSNNIFVQNQCDSNEFAVQIVDVSADNVFTKNNFVPRPTHPDSIVLCAASSAQSFARNWWATKDSVVIRRRIQGAGAPFIDYWPYRLGPADALVTRS